MTLNSHSDIPSSNSQEDDIITEPLLSRSSPESPEIDNSHLSSPERIQSTHTTSQSPVAKNMFRSRKSGESASPPRNERKRRRRKHSRSGSRDVATTPGSYTSISSASNGTNSFRAASREGLCRVLLKCIWKWLTRSPTVAANTVPTQASFSTPRTSRWMGFLARGILWTTVVSLSITVIWYSYELFNHGTDPHLVAWFSAGGFVLLGFPISMWAIVSHLANYNQPQVQVYIVRILWMVPLYSVGSWLAMRFRSYAIYIETVRDLYESYVLYSFLQFLIQVLGGEEALVLMLKDKSPTRGVHMWGLQWCVKPWLMGQPYRKTVYERDNNSTPVSPNSTTSSNTDSKPPAADSGIRGRAIKRVMWKSPFFVKCKFGVLQYVLMKFVTAICIMILEHLRWYHEGDFTPRGGYLYICFVTNISQCWALYCLVLFYYATHNELSPIRPVGKFLSVKALVFFTWWQSVMISYLLWMDMIPAYSIQRQDWTSEDVAKGLQDYLICVEMFLISIVHSFVFPHTEYSPQAVEARSRALNLAPMTKWNKKRLGRSKYSSQYLLFGKDDHSAQTPSLASLGTDVETELVSLNSESDVSGWTSGQDARFGTQFTNESPQSSPALNYFGGNRIIEETESNDVLASPRFDEQGISSNKEAAEDVLLQPTATRLDPGVDMTEQDDEEDDDEEDIDDGDDESTDSGDSDADAVSGDDDIYDEEATLLTSASTSNKRNFMQALLESAVPTDMVDSTVGIVKGEYNIERKTLLNHATASDQYDLFSPNRRYNTKPPSPS